jgi:2Fe-2S ferredoxin
VLTAGSGVDESSGEGRPLVKVTDRSGHSHAIGFSNGTSLMETIRDGGIDDILALCGGCCSCATCHVVVDDAWLADVGAASPEELDLLETSDYIVAGSRLSCQIEMTERLSGLTVTIAPED